MTSIECAELLTRIDMNAVAGDEGTAARVSSVDDGALGVHDRHAL